MRFKVGDKVVSAMFDDYDRWKGLTVDREYNGEYVYCTSAAGIEGAFRLDDLTLAKPPRDYVADHARRSLRMLRGMVEALCLSVDDGPSMWVVPGTRIQFRTKFIEASGVVLSIDHGAVYPIKVEWFTADGDKRITSFSPDEFITLAIKE